MILARLDIDRGRWSGFWRLIRWIFWTSTTRNDGLESRGNRGDLPVLEEPEETITIDVTGEPREIVDAIKQALPQGTYQG